MSSNNSTPKRKAPITIRNVNNSSQSSSIWESRIKMDQVKGGVKVLNANQPKEDQEGVKVLRKLRRNQSESSTEGKKRRSWKSSEAINTAQLRKAKSDIENLGEIQGENCKNVEELEKIETEVEKEIDGELETEKEIEGENEEIINQVEIEGMNLDQMEPTLDKEVELESKEVSIDTTESNPEKIPGLLAENRSINPDQMKSPLGKRTAVVGRLTINPEKKTAPTSNDRALNPEPSPERKPIQSSENRSINPEPVKFSPAKSTLEKKTTPVINHQRAFKSEPRKPIHVEVKYDEVQHTSYRNHNRLQNIVDLVMWRDASKSAFVFGLGTFMLVSSSYTKDLNFSLISATSYMGLAYLVLIFTYKTILLRGANVENEGNVNEGCILLGEEDAIWVLRFLLPYLNELLLTLKSLFSGDPATTMKLALLLFAMARCGSFLTLWTLAKLVFFGVFTIPKICSSYSTHLARYAKFWIERFRDGWEACTHKKAVAAALFTIIWNISSTTARVWAVFMLVVAIKYYQQNMAGEWVEQDDENQEEEEEELNPIKTNKGVGNVLQQRQRRGPVSFELAKERRVKKVM